MMALEKLLTEGVLYGHPVKNISYLCRIYVASITQFSPENSKLISDDMIKVAEITSLTGFTSWLEENR